MDIVDLNPHSFVDIFADAQKGAAPVTTDTTTLGTPKFGMEEVNTDIFTKAPEAPKVEIPAGTDITSTVDDLTNAGKDVDILGTDTKDDKKTDIVPEVKDISEYYKKGIESGKFVNIQEEDDKGNKIQFVPKTFEDLDEVIDIQVNYKLEKERQALIQQVYESRTPAWQAVLKYSEMVDNPQEVIPFLQGIQKIESVANLDEKDLGAAEKIVRIGLESSGQPAEAIETQIEALKTTDKLLTTAEKMKPSILQAEQRQLQTMIQQRRIEENQYAQMVQNISENTIKALEAPIIGKVKLKNEEKAAIYDLIGIPNEGGYEIFKKIDNLYESGDYETLKLVALALTSKDSLISYISSHASDKTAAGLTRVLKAVDANKGSTSGDDIITDVPTVHRNQFSSKPRFGRG